MRVCARTRAQDPYLVSGKSIFMGMCAPGSPIGISGLSVHKYLGSLWGWGHMRQGCAHDPCPSRCVHACVLLGGFACA